MSEHRTTQANRDATDGTRTHGDAADLADPGLSAAARRFAALGHAARLSIVRCLLRAHPLGRVAGELRDELDIPASTLTHHLDALRHEGLISQVREGRFVRYLADTQTLRWLNDFLYSECCSAGPSASGETPSQIVHIGSGSPPLPG